MNRTATANGPAVAPAVETQAEPGLLDQVVQATAEARQFTLEDVRYMAKAGSASGMYGMSEAQAFTLMVICEADGLHPIQALRRFHMMKFRGKDGVERATATLKAAAILAEMQRGGWTVEWTVECDDQAKQEAFFSHPRKCPKGKLVRFTVEDAERAELLTGRNADNWRKYRANMLRARVISNACYMLDPGITQGFYTPEEIADSDDHPSPRLLPSDAPASRVEPPASTPETPAEPAPQDRFWTWLQAAVDRTNNDWAMFCVREKMPHETLVKHVNEALNGVITMWLEKELIRPEDINGSKKGTRSNSKMRSVVDSFNDDDEQDTKNDFNMYFADKWEREAKKLGVNLDSEPREEALSNA